MPKELTNYDDTELERLADEIGRVIGEHFDAENNGDHFIIRYGDFGEFVLHCRLERKDEE